MFDFDILDMKLFNDIQDKYPAGTFIVSKASYLHSRKEWKKAYMKLSEDIRALKSSHDAMIDDAVFLRNGQMERPSNLFFGRASRLQSLRARCSNEEAFMMDALDQIKGDARMTVELIKSGAIQIKD